MKGSMMPGSQAYDDQPDKYTLLLLLALADRAMTIRQVAEILCCPKARVPDIVAQLNADALLVESPDGLTLTITPAGQKLIEQAASHIR